MQPAVTSRRLVDDARELRLIDLGGRGVVPTAALEHMEIELRKAPDGTSKD